MEVMLLWPHLRRLSTMAEPCHLVSFAGVYRFRLTLASLSANDSVCVLSCLLCGGRHPLWVVQAVEKNWVLDSDSNIHGDSHQIIFTGARNSLVVHDPGLSADTLEDQAQPLVKETRSQSKRLEREKKK